MTVVGVADSAAVGAVIGVGRASSHADMETASSTNSAGRAKLSIARETILVLLSSHRSGSGESNSSALFRRGVGATV